MVEGGGGSAARSDAGGGGGGEGGGGGVEGVAVCVGDGEVNVVEGLRFRVSDLRVT